MTDSQLLDELQRLHEAATSGPWVVSQNNDVGPNDESFWEWIEAGPARFDHSRLDQERDQASADASFVSKVHDALPRLLELARRAEPDSGFPGTESAACPHCGNADLLRGWRASAAYEWCKRCGALRTVVDGMCPDGFVRAEPERAEGEELVERVKSAMTSAADVDSIDDQQLDQLARAAVSALPHVARVAEMERELDATRTNNRSLNDRLYAALKEAGEAQADASFALQSLAALRADAADEKLIDERMAFVMSSRVERKMVSANVLEAAEARVAELESEVATLKRSAELDAAIVSAAERWAERIMEGGDEEDQALVDAVREKSR